MYDDLGQLRAVIPPLANSLLTQISFDAFASDLTFAYDYDTRGRMVKKKVPSAVAVTLEYNDRDLLIKTIDGNNNVIETEYDALNRPIRTKQGATVLTETFYDNYSFAGVQAYDAAHAYTQSKLDNVKGLQTGSKVLVLGTSHYITSTTYYEAKGLGVIQNISNTAYEARGIDKSSTHLDFTGRSLSSKRTVKSIETQTKTAYTAGGKVKNTCQAVGTVWQPINKSVYNGIGELTSKVLGCNLQTLDYVYDIQGRLKTLNDPATLVANKDLFGMSLSYDQVGNISNWNYQNASVAPTGTLTPKGLISQSYTYDAWSRIKTANLQKDNASYFELSGLTYDANGNITALNRKLQGVNADVLTYAYANNTNRLERVEDAGSATFFENKNNGTTDYFYDANGNTTQDKNKGISSITYNHLNLASSMIANGKAISYTYTASGEKLQGNFGAGKKYDYIGGLVFANDTLEYISTAEGRWTKTNKFEYYLKDHLGNLRVSCGCDKGILKALQETHYEPFGVELSGLGQSGKTREKFTGKETQELTGLIDFGARQYDNLVPHFLGVDALSEQFYNLTPYNYVGNNPILMIDPDGNSQVIYDFNGNAHTIGGNDIKRTVYQAEDKPDTGSEQQGGEDGKTKDKLDNYDPVILKHSGKLVQRGTGNLGEQSLFLGGLALDIASAGGFELFPKSWLMKLIPESLLGKFGIGKGIISRAERLSMFKNNLSGAKSPSNPKEALNLINKTLDNIELKHAGVDDRMLFINADK